MTTQEAWNDYTKNGYFVGLILMALDDELELMQAAFSAGYEDGGNNENFEAYKQMNTYFGAGLYGATPLDFYIAGVSRKLDRAAYNEWARKSVDLL